MLELEAGFGGFGRERLELLSDAFHVHALQDVGTESWEEGHDGERNILLILLKPPSQAEWTFMRTSKLSIQESKQCTAHFSFDALSWRIDSRTSSSRSET